LAAYSEIVIEQNATFTTTVNVADAFNNPIDLSGYTAQSQLRKSYYSNTFFEFEAEITGTSNGQITLSMSAANTSILPIGRMVYDLIINDGNETVTRVVEGIATVLPAVTR
jgi:hypothetical protein